MLKKLLWTAVGQFQGTVKACYTESALWTSDMEVFEISSGISIAVTPYISCRLYFQYPFNPNLGEGKGGSFTSTPSRLVGFVLKTQKQ